jgi:FlaA1/EpsC-like NDP-sugar epimerase
MDVNNRCRSVMIIAVHLGLIALSNHVAFLLRFDGEIPSPQASLFREMLPWLLPVRSLTFIPFRLYDGFWRYTSIWDLQNIVIGVATSTALFYGLVHHGLGLTAYSRSIFIIDSILLICFMGGIRIAQRMCRQFWRPKGRRRVLVYGAGDAGEMIVHDMINADPSEYEPVGFVDDNRAKIGQRIHGVMVLGSRADLPRILATQRPHEILIAIPGSDAATIRGIVSAVEPHSIKITTLPTLGQILDGKVTLSQIRQLSAEDLLARDAIDLDPAPIRHSIAGRRVMVTGAGGSIGSELCQQIAAAKPAALLLYERHENSLFALANDLADRGYGSYVTSIIGDVGDTARLDVVLREHRPEIIFHAAAHKHVPLMEENPCEAVKNNVTGTRLLADAAERHGVRRFILISSDKAVNPTSVMGATKRVAELIVRARAASGTAFLTVRFGNVLASNGSVVPRFLQQIRAGGPVTVTHPEIRRYFMLISEAVHLVLHAAAQRAGGATYVLDMGEQVKLVDLARNLIRLSGLVPDREIPITFIGLRPGEKLFEELVSADETVVPAGIDRILTVHQRTVPGRDRLAQDVALLESLALEGGTAEMLEQLRVIVPEFRTKATEEVSHGHEVLSAVARGLEVACKAPTQIRITSHPIHSAPPRTSSLIQRARRAISHSYKTGWRGRPRTISATRDPDEQVVQSRPAAQFGTRM